MSDQWWWLSFATEDEFLGGAIVRGGDMIEATLEAHRLGINPGGQVAGIPVPDDRPMPPNHWLERLLSREDVAAFDAEMVPVLDALDEDEDTPGDEVRSFTEQAVLAIVARLAREVEEGLPPEGMLRRAEELIAIATEHFSPLDDA